MGLINEVQVGRINGILHKLLSMKEGAPAPSLMPELQAAITLENDRPEFHFLGGGHLAWGQVNVAASVGNLSLGQLYNPAASGALIVVEHVLLIPSANANMGIYLTETALATNNNAAVWRDTRGRNNPGMNIGLVGEIRSAQQAALPAGTFVEFHQHNATTEFHYRPVRCVLAPGTGLLLGASAATNTAIFAHWSWYERALEPSETR